MSHVGSQCGTTARVATPAASSTAEGIIVQGAGGLPLPCCRCGFWLFDPIFEATIEGKLSFNRTVCAGTKNPLRFTAAAGAVKMQAAALRSGLEPDTGLIKRLPDEVLALLFRFLDPKTLVMAIPAVSACAGGTGMMVCWRPVLGHGVHVGPVTGRRRPQGCGAACRRRPQACGGRGCGDALALGPLAHVAHRVPARVFGFGSLAGETFVEEGPRLGGRGGEVCWFPCPPLAPDLA